MNDKKSCGNCVKLERENAELKLKLSATIHWLERNQPNVFSRGLWDFINRAEALVAGKGCGK